jgi:hypothetical protein
VHSPLPRLTAALAIAGLAACVATAPEVERRGAACIVRAPDPVEATAVLELAQRQAKLIAELYGPGAQAPRESRPLSIWLQDEPAQPGLGLRSHADAEGFYAHSHHRIHLRRDAERLDRTLAHELAHACLPPEWRQLPGSLEEGLCDTLSTLVVPDSAASLRAGRLSAAAFATGGLLVEVMIDLPDEGGPTRATFATRLRLEADEALDIEPSTVFDLDAGLSGGHAEAAERKALYGLAYLVVSRAHARRGIEGLRELCSDKSPGGAERWLRAAELSLEQPGLRLAIGEEFGPRETWELLRRQPEFLVELLAAALLPWEDDLEAALARTRVRLAFAGGDPRGMELPFVRALRARVEQAQATLKGRVAAQDKADS